MSCILLLSLPACAARGDRLELPAPESLPAGSPLRSATLPEGDAWLRHHLRFGTPAEGVELARASRVAPSDALVRSLQEATLLRESGDFAGSNAALEWAEAEADRRYTRSVSRAMASLAINDRTMAWTPGASELVMIPFYRILNHLALGDQGGALVEARKAAALIDRLEVEAEDRCRLDGLVLFLAGVVQGAGGERNDAVLSLRRADRYFAGCDAAPAAVGSELVRAARALGLGEVADSAEQRYAAAWVPSRAEVEGGELVLLVEEGFVAHRAAESIHLPLLPAEIDGLDVDDDLRLDAALAEIHGRLLRDLGDPRGWDRHPARHGGGAHWAYLVEDAYLLRLAWPSLRREPLRPASVRVLVDDSVYAVHPFADLSARAERELAADRPAMLSRLVARGVVKFVATRELERKAEKQGGELLGFLAGRLGNLAANELERADTRSWSLLPDRVGLARLRLPAGPHRIRIETLGPRGEPLELRDLGIVEIRPGGLEVRTARVWGDERG